MTGQLVPRIETSTVARPTLRSRANPRSYILTRRVNARGPRGDPGTGGSQVHGELLVNSQTVAGPPRPLAVTGDTFPLVITLPTPSLDDPGTWIIRNISSDNPITVAGLVEGDETVPALTGLVVSLVDTGGPATWVRDGFLAPTGEPGGGGSGPDLSDATPADLGTAAAGVSTDASRADHVHDMPSAADVGADPAGTAAGLVDDLSGVTNASTARTALGLGTAATKDSGTGSGNVILGNDARLTDSRTPAAHKSSHATGGGDALTASDIGAAPATLTVGTGLGTSGTVNLDMSSVNGTVQWVTASGALTFTTSNRAAGRSVTLVIDAGGSSRTLAWPSWIAQGAALPTTLASGKRLIVTVLFLDSTDAAASAAASAQL